MRHITTTVAARSDTRGVTSVFFGGGTPSLLAGDQLVRILAALPLAPGAEVTVEANPDTVSPELFATYVDGGVTRVSLGVQSMVPHVLAALGRTHDPANVERAVDWARAAGLEDVNLDLIYGAVGESVADWSATVDRAVALEPTHISAYGLTVEAGTPLAADPVRHPDDDDQADKYLLATERFAAAGLAWYEISNWARPGHPCRHNQLYWEQGDYLAFGAAAHGHLDGVRWWNLRTPERYIEAVRRGEEPEAGREVLDAATRDQERLQLLLRTDAGVDVGALPVGGDPSLEGLVERRGDRWVLTVPGRLLANEVALRLS